MLTCKEASQLVSEGLDRPLSLGRRLSLRMHVFMCGACRAFKRQVEAIEQLLRLRAQAAPRPDAPGKDPLGLSYEKRERLRDLLRRPG